MRILALSRKDKLTTLEGRESHQKGCLLEMKPTFYFLQ